MMAGDADDVLVQDQRPSIVIVPDAWVANNLLNRERQCVKLDYSPPPPPPPSPPPPPLR